MTTPIKDFVDFVNDALADIAGLNNQLLQFILKKPSFVQKKEEKRKEEEALEQTATQKKIPEASEVGTIKTESGSGSAVPSSSELVGPRSSPPPSR